MSIKYWYLIWMTQMCIWNTVQIVKFNIKVFLYYVFLTSIVSAIKHVNNNYSATTYIYSRVMWIICSYLNIKPKLVFSDMNMAFLPFKRVFRHTKSVDRYGILFLRWQRIWSNYCYHNSEHRVCSYISNTTGSVKGI